MFAVYFTLHVQMWVNVWIKTSEWRFWSYWGPSWMREGTYVFTRTHCRSFLNLGEKTPRKKTITACFGIKYLKCAGFDSYIHLLSLWLSSKRASVWSPSTALLLLAMVWYSFFLGPEAAGAGVPKGGGGGGNAGPHKSTVSADIFPEPLLNKL